MSEKKSAITGLNEQEEEKLCEEEEELTELDELTMDIVAVVAYNTATNFEKMVHEINQESINNISRVIESMPEENLVDLQKHCLLFPTWSMRRKHLMWFMFVLGTAI